MVETPPSSLLTKKPCERLRPDCTSFRAGGWLGRFPASTSAAQPRFGAFGRRSPYPFFPSLLLPERWPVLGDRRAYLRMHADGWPAVGYPSGAMWMIYDLTVGILAVVAQDEAKRISERTKAALAEAKKRGTQFGNPQGAKPLQAWLREHGYNRVVQGIKRKADAFALDVVPIITDIEEQGITSNAGIARELNARKIRNARGGVGSFTDTTVGGVRRQLCPAEAAQGD
jgi:hypothetical protein